MNQRFVYLAFATWLACAAVPARAVVVAGDTGTTDEAAPVVMDASGDNVGGNVGTFNGASGIYIGNGWVLTADHVGAGNPVFPGVNNNEPFTYDGTSGRPLTMPDGTGQADLYLFHLTADPALPNMPLSTMSGSTLAMNNTSVVMYGRGQSLTSGFNYYNTATNPYTVSATATNEGGYSVGSGAQVFRAGTNFIAGSQANVNDGYGMTNSLLTLFNPNFVNNTTDNTRAEAQGSNGDSGGAVFGKTSGGTYVLVGMMFAIGDDLNSGSNEPSTSTAAYSLDGTFAGNGTTTGDSVTASADISSYFSQIEAITGVPEPSTRWASVLAGAALLGACRRRIGVRRSREMT